MAFDMIRMERGQVWCIRAKPHVQVSGSEQDKDRPWVILSIGKFNHTSGMVTCAPITTRDAIRTPAQVIYTNLHNTKNVILCEQIKTFDYKSGDYIFDFAGVLSDDVMRAVDKALMVHLGINTAPMTLNKLYESVETFVNNILETKKERTVSDDDVLSIAEKIESLVTDTVKKEKKNSGVSYESYINKRNPYDCFQDPDDDIVTKPKDTVITIPAPGPLGKALPVQPSSNKPSSPPSPMNTSIKFNTPEVSKDKKQRKKMTKWTKETIEKYLSDCENLPMKEVMDIWGITRKQGVYTTKHYVQGLLKTL